MCVYALNSPYGDISIRKNTLMGTFCYFVLYGDPLWGHGSIFIIFYTLMGTWFHSHHIRLLIMSHKGDFGGIIEFGCMCYTRYTFMEGGGRELSL